MPHYICSSLLSIQYLTSTWHVATVVALARPVCACLEIEKIADSARAEKRLNERSSRFLKAMNSSACHRSI